jgi:predicted small lipoprotein YifL
MRSFFVLVPLVLLVGCGQGGPSYMPLVDEKEWQYSETSSFQRNVPTIKVGKKISVGGFEGRVLTGELGESRLAWSKKTLYASMLANTIFNPPIPLLVEDKIPEKKKSREDELVRADSWDGHFESLGKTRGATATLSQRRVTVQLTSGETNVVETVLRVQIDGAKGDVPIEVRTWFERGVGIVRQEQRTNRTLIVGIEKIGSK